MYGNLFNSDYDFKTLLVGINTFASMVPHDVRGLLLAIFKTLSVE